MITPVRTLKVGVLCERKDDLLVSVDDIKMIAKDERAKAIDEFAERLLEKAPKNYDGGLELGGMSCYLSANQIKEIAEQLKKEGAV